MSARRWLFTLAAITLITAAPARSSPADEPADPARHAAGSDDPRAVALQIYSERCAVEAGSAAAAAAEQQYDRLLEKGHEPAAILEIAADIPHNCGYASFETAILHGVHDPDRRRYVVRTRHPPPTTTTAAGSGLPTAVQLYLERCKNLGDEDEVRAVSQFEDLRSHGFEAAAIEAVAAELSSGCGYTSFDIAILHTSHEDRVYPDIGDDSRAYLMDYRPGLMRSVELHYQTQRGVGIVFAVSGVGTICIGVGAIAVSLLGTGDLIGSFVGGTMIGIGTTLAIIGGSLIDKAGAVLDGSELEDFLDTARDPPGVYPGVGGFTVRF